MSLVKYTSIPIKENNEPMISLAQFDFVLEPKYYQQGLSDDKRMWVREGIAKKLVKIQKNLGKLRLKIWDTFRSRDVQNNIYQKYWQDLKKQKPSLNEEELKLEVGKFVSPPYQTERIPPHATGGTVDLTLVDENEKELDMGTEFDFFGAEASPFFYEIYKDKIEITKNRKILRDSMQAEDFTLDEDEWWHFDWGNQMWALKSGQPYAFYGEAK